jgi:hypothetical protein
MFTYTFTPKGMTAREYDLIISKLEEAGAGSPKGRLYHVCFGSSNDLRIVDVWDTPENFDEFGKTLMPILQEVGVDPGQPEVQVVHNIIEAVAELNA